MARAKAPRTRKPAPAAAAEVGNGPLVTLEEADRQLEKFLVELRARMVEPGRYYQTRGLDLKKEYATVGPILESPQVGMWLCATLSRIASVQQLYLSRGTGTPEYLGGGIDTRPFTDAHEHLKLLASALLRAKPLLGEAEAIHVLDVMRRAESLAGLRHLLPWAGLAGAIERCVASHTLSAPLRAAIERARSEFFRNSDVVMGKDDLAIRKRLEALL